MYYFRYSRNRDAYVIYNPENQVVRIVYDQDEARRIVQDLNNLY